MILIMKTINEFKNLLGQIGKDVLIKSNELECDNLYYDYIYLESVEEDIALWKKGNCVHKNYCYFYTDLEGKLLFNGKTFKYATPFSNFRACVNNYREWLVLDLENKEIIVFPKELIFENINIFRNDGLPLFDRDSLSWGSVRYNPNEKSFKKDIPFIWDTLEFSRVKDQVYVGKSDIYLSGDNHPYSHWNDGFDTMFTLKTMKLPVDQVKDLSCYNYRKDFYIGMINQDVIRYIEEKISSTVPPYQRREMIEIYLKTAYNISDYYFEEEYKEEVNNNEGKIVDVGVINEYQKTLGKWIN